MTTFFKGLESILISLRLKDWYASKVPLILSLGLFLLTTQSEKGATLAKIIGFLLYYMCLMTFGYGANDWLDYESDTLAQKRTLQNRPVLHVRLLILLVLFSVGLRLIPTSNWMDKAAAIGIFLLAFLYSAPPVRLKERGILGLITSSLVQLALPALLFITVFREKNITTFIIIGWYFLIGLRWVMIHQIEDFSNDQKSNTKTFTIIHGLKLTESLITYLVLPIEIFLLSITIFSQKGCFFYTLIIGFIVYLGWEIGMFILRRRTILPVNLISFNWVPLADYYQIFWPISLSIYLAIITPQLSFLPFLFMIMQYKYIWKQLNIFYRLCNYCNL
jgi:4-hydroxybenzoate polyprenyltransferase